MVYPIAIRAIVPPNTRPLASCSSRVDTSTSISGGGKRSCLPPPHGSCFLGPKYLSALELAGLDRVELLARHLVHGQQLAGAVAVLVEAEVAGSAGALVRLHVLDEVGALVVAPRAVVLQRGAQRSDDHVRRVVGERTIGAER